MPLTPVSRLGSYPRLVVRWLCYVPCVLVTLMVSLAQAQTPAAGVVTSPEPAWVAVMPFANLNRHPADEWIGAGIAETVSVDLTRVGLTLVEQTAVLGAIGTRDTVGRERVDDTRALEIGRQLGATLLVRGTYQRVGDRLRITAHVVDVRSGSVVHSAKIDGSLSGVFAAQDQIVLALAERLAPSPDRAPGSAVRRAPAPPARERRAAAPDGTLVPADVTGGLALPTAAAEGPPSAARPVCRIVRGRHRDREGVRGGLQPRRRRGWSVPPRAHTQPQLSGRRVGAPGRAERSSERSGLRARLRAPGPQPQLLRVPQQHRPRFSNRDRLRPARGHPADRRERGIQMVAGGHAHQLGPKLHLPAQLQPCGRAGRRAVPREREPRVRPGNLRFSSANGVFDGSPPGPTSSPTVCCSVISWSTTRSAARWGTTCCGVNFRKTRYSFFGVLSGRLLTSS